MDVRSASETDPRIARYAALQSVTEIGIGSVVHGLRIPLGGHFLSLNQGVLLTFAIRPSADAAAARERPERFARKRAIFVATSVSFVTAMLKFLSPAGSRWQPAVGISVQGLLYAAGLAVFGPNVAGAIVGLMLLSVWPFLHPVVVGTLIFGHTLIDAVVKVWTTIAEKTGVPVELGIWILVGAIAAKALLAAGLAVFAWRANPDREARYFARIGRWAERGTRAAGADRPAPPEADRGFAGAAIGATKDLLRPIFLVSLALTVGFVFFAGQGAGDALAYLGRTVAIAWFLFLAIRAFPRRWAERIQSRFPALAATAAEVRRSRS